MELAVVKRALKRHLRANSLPPYERVLQSITARGDIWAPSQGEYIAWWRTRKNASFKVWVSDGQMWADTDLDRAVFEKHPDRFFPSGKATACGAYEGSFSGEIEIVIDATLERKELLIDALQREGILNYVVGQSGEFLLSHELDPLLENMETHLYEKVFRLYDQDILRVRDIVTAMLAKRGLPLIRVWYHPQVNGRVAKAVFTSRYDVDRAITNMPKIVRTEAKYGASSTMYVRIDQPFYKDKDIVALDRISPTHEIALHAELASHAAQHGGDIAALQAEKVHLERVIGRSVTGLSLHGGELISNRSQHVWEAMECCDFEYDTSHGPTPYYLPYRQMKADGQLETTYRFRCHFRDIDLPSDGENGSSREGFYERAIKTLDEVLDHNGIMVLLLHPMYFGFFAYLCSPKNLARFMRFAPTYVGRVLKLGHGQQQLNLGDI